MGLGTGSRGSSGPRAEGLMEARSPYVIVDALLDACCKPGGMLGYKVGGGSRQRSHLVLVLSSFKDTPRGSKYLRNAQSVV